MAKTVINSSGRAASHHVARAAAVLRRRDPVLRRIIDRVGPCQLRPKRAYFFILCDSIISQQLSIKASSVILERFRAHCAKQGKHPTPKEVLACDAGELRRLGLSHQKISYLKDLALRFRERRIDPRTFSRLSDEEIIARLCAVKGIGRWTAEMFLIFSLCRLDVWPVDDLGIKKAVRQQYGLERRAGSLPTAKQLASFADKKPWRPYRSVVSWYLWRSMAAPASTARTA